MHVYFDNAATTPVDPLVLDAMWPVMATEFGNPSSIHHFGRKTRNHIELARKQIAHYLGVAPSELFFTSGGTEADNMVLQQCTEAFGVKHIITAKTEHHAVEHTAKILEQQGKIKLHWVQTDSKGNIDLEHLEGLLKSNPDALVSLMHANNEIGTLLPLDKVGQLCESYKALFHSDTVQTMGHYALQPKRDKVHFMTCAAHKFHGPKGIGFLYMDGAHKLTPLIHGGAQERQMRGGTENVAGIVGLAKAFELCYTEMETHQAHIYGLKQEFIAGLKNIIPDIEFNGETDFEKALYTVLNCRFPEHPDAEMLLFNLDIKGIAASGGSACSSGSNQGSHVLRALGVNMNKPSVRFSFSKFNTSQEIQYTLNTLKHLLTN